MLECLGLAVREADVVAMVMAMATEMEIAAATRSCWDTCPTKARTVGS